MYGLVEPYVALINQKYENNPNRALYPGIDILVKSSELQMSVYAPKYLYDIIVAYDTGNYDGLRLCRTSKSNEYLVLFLNTESGLTSWKHEIQLLSVEQLRQLLMELDIHQLLPQNLTDEI